MYYLSLLFFRSNSIKGRSVSHAQVGSYLSQTILSFKPTVTRALHLASDVQIFTASKFRLCNLRSGGSKQNGKKLAEGYSRSFVSTRQMQFKPLNINTDVMNNVYLFRYEKPGLFMMLNISAAMQLIFWLGIAYVLSLDLPKRDPDQSPWKKYAADNGYTLIFVVMATLVGTCGSFMLWAFTARSVKYLILNKGGKNVTLVTYHALNKKMTVPVNQLKCKRSRKEMKNYMPVKMSGRLLFYILDTRGEFVNPTLFDYTVAAHKQ